MHKFTAEFDFAPNERVFLPGAEKFSRVYACVATEEEGNFYLLTHSLITNPVPESEITKLAGDEPFEEEPWDPDEFPELEAAEEQMMDDDGGDLEYDEDAGDDDESGDQPES